MQASKSVRNEHQIKCAILGLSGFVLSVFFILWGLLVLVRFYIFDSILYNLFLLCILFSGNLTSLDESLRSLNNFEFFQELF